eukprot:15049582-Ditylum_brightwellii.AAC.1
MAFRTTRTGNHSQCWTLKSMGMNSLSCSDEKCVYNFTHKETHGKDKFSVFTEDGKIIQLETFPKKSVEIKSMFKYSVNNHWKNISL